MFVDIDRLIKIIIRNTLILIKYTLKVKQKQILYTKTAC